jgi:hypothetical protein
MRLVDVWTLRIFVAGLLVGLAIYVGVRPRQQMSADYGYTPNPEGVREFLAELDQPLFRDAGAETIREAKGVDTFLYRSMYKAHAARYGKPWRCIRQGIGDCVSMGWGEHAVYIALCVDWETGRLAEPPLRVSSESSYGGSRVEARNKPEGGGGWSDGSYGGAAARWYRDWGTVFRDNIGGHDLREYSPDRAKQWGNWGNGGQGDKGKLDGIAKKHPAKHVALVRSFDEAAAAIEAGFPIAVCSMSGFSSRRDDGGWASPEGRSTTRWAHCLCFAAVRYKKNGSARDGLLALNSWSSWNSGPVWPDDQPEGSFWVSRETVDAMLAGLDSFAVGSVQGFGWRDLHHGEWLAPVPTDSLTLAQ